MTGRLSVRLAGAATFVLLVAAGCQNEGRPVAAIDALPVASGWVAHPDNPVIPAGSLADRGLWNDPSVLRLGPDRLVMYLTSSTEVPFKPPVLPFRAVSRDGIRWTLEPATPLLDVAGTPYVSIETPSVVRFGGRWHMYFSGILPDDSVPKMHVGHALSDDGVHWRVDPDGVAVIQATGRAGDWNGYLVAEPGAVVFEGRIHLYFTAIGPRQTIGLATSGDGTTFDAPRVVLSLDETLFPPENGFVGYSAVSANVRGNRVHLFYNVAYRDDEWGWQQVALHHSVSENGATDWRQDPSVTFTRSSFDWTQGGIIGPNVLFDGGRARMWFAGHMFPTEFGRLAADGWRGRQFGIGYAETSASRFD